MLAPAIVRPAAIFDFYNREAENYIRNWRTGHTRLRYWQVDDFVSGCKTYDIWNYCDLIYLLAIHDEGVAKVNLRYPNIGRITVGAAGTGAHVSDRGYLGDASASYWRTNHNAVTAGMGYSLNDAHMSVWNLIDITSATQYDCGNSNGRINARNASGTIRVAANMGAADVTIPGLASSAGWTAWTRPDATQFNAVKDNGTPVNSATASTSVTNTDWSIGAQGSGGSPSGREQAFFSAGRHLTDAKLAAFFTLVQTWLGRVGAI